MDSRQSHLRWKIRSNQHREAADELGMRIPLDHWQLPTAPSMTTFRAAQLPAWRRQRAER
jgi:hypothetical protein